MDVREKLIELLDRFVFDEWYSNDDIADKLISNGVTVQECKLEDKKTKADRIRSMNDEELAGQLGLMTTICEFCAKQKNCEDAQDYNCCMEGIFKWLQQPAEEADNEAN